MTHRRSNRISTFGSQLTSIVSVSLVLLILGVLAIVGAASGEGADMLRSNLGFVVKISREAPETEINRLKRTFSESAFVQTYIYSSADEIMASESQYLGEDIASLVDVNPYGAEFEIKVTPAYSSVDSIEALAARFVADPAVDDVLTESAMIAAVNSTLGRIAWVLGAVAVALLVISVVLINNTVRLAVYSRRFIIHTMKLVGATGSFIRRPFVLAGALNGVISAAIASILLVCGVIYGANADPLLASVFSLKVCAIVVVCLFAVGALLCTAASALATNHYLRADYDDMFMK